MGLTGLISPAHAGEQRLPQSHILEKTPGVSTCGPFLSFMGCLPITNLIVLYNCFSYLSLIMWHCWEHWSLLILSSEFITNS